MAEGSVGLNLHGELVGLLVSNVDLVLHTALSTSTVSHELVEGDIVFVECFS